MCHADESSGTSEEVDLEFSLVPLKCGQDEDSLVCAVTLDVSPSV